MEIKIRFNKNEHLIKIDGESVDNMTDYGLRYEAKRLIDYSDRDVLNAFIAAFVYTNGKNNEWANLNKS